MMTSYIKLIISLALHEASHLSMFQLQAEHRHAAGLIDLLFKRCLICFYSCFATQAGC